MNKKLLFFAMALLVFVSAPLVHSQTTVGGDVKFFLYDKSWGTSQDSTDSDTETAGFSRVYFYIMSELSDRISIDVRPEIRAESGATPVLGRRIGEQRPSASGIEPTLHLDRAAIKVLLPRDVELTAGLFRPLFTEDYGAQRFFHEEYHASNAIANEWLAAWHDFGIELYKSFDVEMGSQWVSIPVYFYLLNGQNLYNENLYTDNNQNKSILLHVAPEYSGFRLLGSLAFGKWDNEDKYKFLRWCAGAAYDYMDFTFRGEFFVGEWDHQFLVLEQNYRDVRPWGYYVKVGYHIIPETLRVLFAYHRAEHDFGGFVFTGTSLTEKYVTWGPRLNYFVTPGSAILLQIDRHDWKNEDGTQELKANRVTIGWRTIFP